MAGCSVIIPAWNEAEHLETTIRAARRALNGCEIIVVDGGSTDSTAALASQWADLCISCQRQRAAQMNAGASAATGDLLLFLHADTLLAPGSGESLRKAFLTPNVAGGGFARRFDSPSRFLQFTCYVAEARCRAFGWFLGDQAIFCQKRGVRTCGRLSPAGPV